MFPRQFARRFGIVSMIIITLMVASTPPVEAKLVDDNPVETIDEPRYTVSFKPFGPYYLKTPPPSSATRLAAKPVEEPPLGPQWINNQYTIMSGDTLSALIPHLGFSVKELAACSGINNPNRIQPKQIIHKPGTTCVAPRPVPQQVPNPAPLPSGGIVETAISFAMAQLGDPYVWAANGPDSWDCSGLVHAAFNYAGKSITRSTRTLINEGSPVGRDSMMRGDLVFPDDGHVGIYLGDNQFIHAPQSGDVVKISSVYSFYAARRIT